MRVALWQKPRESCQRGDGGKRRSIVEHARGMGLHHLDIEAPEML